MFKLFLLTLMFVSSTGCLMKPSGVLLFQSTSRGPASADYETLLQVADRGYVESVLADAFGTEGTSEATYLQQMTIQRHEFGGPCDRYEASELNGRREFPRADCFSGMRNNTITNANPARFSLTMQVCDRLISTAPRFNHFLSKIYGTAPVAAPTTATIQRAYGIFFREEVPSPSVVNGFKDLVKGSSPQDAWKLITTAICVSPEWQIQ